MRRKPGALVPLELAILQAGLDLRLQGLEEFHGYRIARQIESDSSARRLTAYGSLYRALARLERMGFVSSRAEDPRIAAREHRPIRHLYQVTPAGEQAYARADTQPAGLQSVVRGFAAP
jgi:DNA-binding PadR family transcriptional regulator